MKSRLWLALRLLDLPLRSVPAYTEEQAVCVLEKQKVVAANAAAINAGVCIGMDSTTAHLLSGCITYQRDCGQEQNYLNQLAEYLYKYSPYIQIHRSLLVPESGLLLEISRCLKLFGGLVSLCNQIFSAMQDTPFSYGLAHTQEGAWLLSYECYEITGTEDVPIFTERLNRAPIDRLFDWPVAVEALKRTGFVYLADITRQINSQSISGIKKRFGHDFAHYITKVFGIEQDFQQPILFSEPAEAYQPKEFFFDSTEFDYPIAQVDQLYVPIEKMLQKLGEFLRKRKLACQNIEWRFFDIYQRSYQLKVGCANPQNSEQLLYELTLIQLQNQQLPFEVDAIEITCRDLHPWREENAELDFSGRKKTGSCNDMALLDAKLKARLGEKSVYKISYKDDHIPELTYKPIATFAVAESILPDCQKTAPRPTWLFKTPLPVKMQKSHLFWRGKLELSVGPERIEGQWWIQHTARDYYMAIREDGLRVWVYQDLLSETWFVQGVFAG